MCMYVSKGGQKATSGTQNEARVLSRAMAHAQYMLYVYVRLMSEQPKEFLLVGILGLLLRFEHDFDPLLKRHGALWLAIEGGGQVEAHPVQAVVVILRQLLTDTLHELSELIRRREPSIVRLGWTRGSERLLHDRPCPAVALHRQKYALVVEDLAAQRPAFGVEPTRRIAFGVLVPR